MQNIKNNKKLTIFIILTSILTILFFLSPLGIELANARPGGGHSYSGGGSSSNGGGGGGDIGFLIYLIFTKLPPQVSIPLVIGIIVFRIIIMKRRERESKTIISSPGVHAIMNRSEENEREIARLKSYDPNFSKVLFLDFVSSIYNKFYTWYGTKDFKNLSPFFSNTEIQSSIHLLNKRTVNEIVIGSIKISEINNLETVTGISVDIEANYTINIQEKKTRYRVVERWYFNRKAGILSSEPEKMRKLSCPNCGAPGNFTDKGECQSCGTQINKGEMQWFVKKHKILKQEVFISEGLAHYEQERGTNLPTIFQANFSEISERFAQKHNFEWNSWRLNFSSNIATNYFLKIYAAWSTNKLEDVRNLLSDRIYESFMFWINTYKKAGLTNKLEEIKISNIQAVRIDIDKYYESITVRIFASALDYVEDSSGNIEGGSKNNARFFSEYWTFIRRNGVEKDTYNLSTCPNCGAPADKMGQAGICEYCDTKISNGDFSWVLAIITQDEVYAG